MPENEHRESGVGTLGNKDLAPLGDAAAGVAEAGGTVRARMARENRAYEPLTESEREARDALRSAAVPRGADDIGLAETVRKAYAGHNRLRDLGEDSLITLDVAPMAQPRADIGMWWWGETSWWWPPDLLGLSVFWQDDGLHFRGQLNWDDGDLWFGSTGATAIFAIGADRLPPPGWYRSIPRVNLWGEVWGFTGVNGPWNWGDTWSKCWLHANQKISVAGGPMINQAHWFDTLYFYEDQGSHGVRPLPGTFTFPEIFFEVVPGRPLVAELELKFDIQLEGSSAFRFGNYGGWVDAVLQTPQWTLFR